MVNYEAQVNQTPYHYSNTTRSSYNRKIGGMLAGGLLGTLAYYIPVTKDCFVQRGFEMSRNEAYEEIRTLKNIAKEVEAGEVSTESKMILQDLGLPENVTAITTRCSQLDEKFTQEASVKSIKNRFAVNFDRYKNKPSLMDAAAADAYKAAKQNKFKWGIGIGAAIGLALGLITSRD